MDVMLINRNQQFGHRSLMERLGFVDEERSVIVGVHQPLNAFGVPTTQLRVSSMAGRLATFRSHFATVIC